KLGIELVNFNIQNFRDNAGTIENMGIDNVEQIRKNAQIAKANAQRDIAIASAHAQEESNAVQVETDKKIAEQNAALAVQQAEMQIRADTKKAEADAAYSIQQENQRKTIEVTRTNADIARREKEAELAEKEVAIRERKLDAEVRKAADAKKYQAEREAEADLIRRQRDADAKKYEALQEAEARKAAAEAARFAMEQEAEGIRAKGLAEAEAIEKKAEAQRKMGEASILEMYLAALPEVVKNAAAPLAQTDKIVMYGDGNSSRLVKDVMQSSSQIIEGLKESTGIDLTAIISGFATAKAATHDSKKETIQQDTIKKIETKGEA
ncbi:MAG: flotillin family protein, partial [Clostridia bacterium]|nr:flotillin family protein [Clostridia bacterium]